MLPGKTPKVSKPCLLIKNIQMVLTGKRLMLVCELLMEIFMIHPALLVILQRTMWKIVKEYAVLALKQV